MRKVIKIKKIISNVYVTISAVLLIWGFLSWLNIAANNTSIDTVNNVWDWNLIKLIIGCFA